MKNKNVLEKEDLDKISNDIRKLHDEYKGFNKEIIEKAVNDDLDFEASERSNFMIRKLKVVVVDDMKVLADNLTKTISENENVEEVFTEYNGEDGLISILNNEPDIIFTDNQMPVKNGIELMEELELYKFERKPKVILVTADNDVQLITKSRELGFEIVHKPIQADTINYILNDIAGYEEKFKEEKVIEVKKENLFKRILKKLLKK